MQAERKPVGSPGGSAQRFHCDSTLRLSRPSANVVVVEDVGPEDYESLTGTPKAAYESRLLELTRNEMLKTINEGAPARSPAQVRGSVESVELADDGPDPRIIVIFRVDAIPGIRCGWSYPIWPAPVPDGGFGTSLEDRAHLSASGIVEVFESTPPSHLARDLDIDGIAWF